MITMHENALNDEDFRRVSDAVYRHCGIVLSDEKKGLVRARLAKEMRTARLSSPAEYLDRVFADPQGPAFTQFIDALSTNLTSFFRENDHFDFLAARWLPQLLARRAAAGERRLTVWSAACSTGEEPYSLSIVLHEALAALGDHQPWDLRLLATDISTRVLRVAMNGVYDASRLDSVSGDRRMKYFERTAPGHGRSGSYSASPDIRRPIRFRHLNLIDSWPFTGPFDFIFCRNVMIYFDKPTQQKLVSRFHGCLPSGGLLFTGHAESLTGVPHRFRNVRPSIYEKP